MLRTTVRIFTLTLSLSFFTLSSAFSATVKKDDGKVLEGQILDQDAGYLYLDTSSGVINIPKANILELNGQPFDSGPKDTAEQRYGTGRALKTDAGGLGLEPNLVARVGQGGIGEKEFYWYLVRAGHRNISSYKDVPAAQRKEVLEQAIDDEVLFQEALHRGYHEEAVTKKSIAELYKNESQIAGIEPSQMQEDEIRAYYDAHPELFKKPARFNFKVLPLALGGMDIEKAKSNPAAVQGWKSGDWLEAGDTFHLPLSQDQLDQIYAMKKGAVQEFTDSMGAKYLFWLADYQASASKPFEQSIEKVKHEMIKAKMADNTKAFDAQFKSGTGKTPTIDELFKEALKAGTHRERFTRSGIINAYVASKGADASKLAATLRKSATIEILDPELQ